MGAEVVDAVRENMWRRTEAEEKRFLAAVESIEPPISREIVEALFDTFLPIDDFGTQESVVERLSLAPAGLYFDVLGDRIASLANRAPDWADDIILRASIFEQPLMIRMLLNNDGAVREDVLSFMKKRLPDEPEVQQVIEAVEAALGSS